MKFCGYIILIPMLWGMSTGDVWSEELDKLKMSLFYSANNADLGQNYLIDQDKALMVDASLGYGCLGAYQGGVYGCLTGAILGRGNGAILIGSIAGGAIIGGYLGAKVDEDWEEAFVVGGVSLSMLMVAALYKTREKYTHHVDVVVVEGFAPVFKIGVNKQSGKPARIRSLKVTGVGYRPACLSCDFWEIVAKSDNFVQLQEVVYGIVPQGFRELAKAIPLEPGKVYYLNIASDNVAFTNSKGSYSDTISYFGPLKRGCLFW